jgi:hypothetical protein
VRKCSRLRAGGLLFCLLSADLGYTQTAGATDAPGGPTYHALSTTLLERAENEVAKIKALVDDGTLPKSRLAEAEAALDDARDEAILGQTLYGELRIGDMTPDQTRAMVEAAKRRVERQKKIVEDRQKLLDTGILARSEFAAFQDELNSRQNVLDLALHRAKLVDDLKQMADVERRFERASRSATGLQYAMTRYEGSGFFNLNELTTISNKFEKQFHHSLPISALGQTLVHQSMGLDHRNRVDVAVNPDEPEGIWLLQLLERQRVPYLAFRSAIAGAATAPHIHIGPGSTRLKLAQR